MQRIIPHNAVLIPAAAERVFEGVIFDVYQWQQKLFDGSQATFEMLRRPDTVEIIAIKDGKIVMLHEDQPHRGRVFTFPGGRVDSDDDSWLAAAQRELLEETGMRFASWRLVDVRQPQRKIEWFGVTFVAWGFESQQDPSYDAGEDIAVELLPLQKLQEAIRDPALSLLYARDVLESVQSTTELQNLPEFKGKTTE